MAGRDLLAAHEDQPIHLLHLHASRWMSSGAQASGVRDREGLPITCADGRCRGRSTRI
jgi:hypothetical protein